MNSRADILPDTPDSLKEIVLAQQGEIVELRTRYERENNLLREQIQRKRHGNRIFFLGPRRVIMDPIETTTDKDSDDRTQDKRRSGKIQAPLADTRQGPGKERLEQGGILSSA